MPRFLLLLIPTLTILICCGFLFKKEGSKKILKHDFIELSRAKYGIFNVDQWEKILIGILSKKVDELDVSNATEEEVGMQVSTFLYKTIDDFENDYKTANKRKSFLGISARNLGADFFDLFDGMRKQVPKITKDVVEYIKDPENKEKLKAFLARKVGQYADETFSEVDYTLRDDVIEKYGKDSRENTLLFLKESLVQHKKETLIIKILLYASAIILFFLLIFQKGFTGSELLFATGATLAILCFGLYLPMIDIDARISEFAFTVLGEPVYFSNQVIYFKSKSILEVVSLMLTQSQWDTIAVGLLVLSFSVLLPVSKLLFFAWSRFNLKIRNGKFCRFLIGKTGKWSMADVLVVAIFMSYIGFSSLLTEQLSQLDRASSSLRVLTTNHSELNTGFFLFFTFVVLSIALSEAGTREKM